MHGIICMDEDDGDDQTGLVPGSVGTELLKFDDALSPFAVSLKLLTFE